MMKRATEVIRIIQPSTLYHAKLRNAVRRRKL